MSRLDLALVERGLAASRTQAQALIREGRVSVDGRVVRRPSHNLATSTSVEVADGVPDAGESYWISRGWVGRGAVKLDHALGLWEPRGLDVRGRRCLDVGASTGGFTQVLLEHGAARVDALDVGHDQLAPSLRQDPRVRDLSGTHVKDLDPDLLGSPAQVVVCDVSFISLRQVLAPVAAVCAGDAHLVVLVKPQFEVGREQLARDGVVRSSASRRRAVTQVLEHLPEVGLVALDLAPSPVRGGAARSGAAAGEESGNVEYLLWLRPAGVMMGVDPTPDLDTLLAVPTLEEHR